MNLLEENEIMRLAVDEARKCEPVETAYSVGCVIIDEFSGKVLSSGFSRELPGNTHAEECAVAKLKQLDTKPHAIHIYTTMEPCSQRLSGKLSCTDRILELNRTIKVSKVICGILEPDNFVLCKGRSILRQNGIETVLFALSDENLRNSLTSANSHLIPQRK